MVSRIAKILWVRSMSAYSATHMHRDFEPRIRPYAAAICAEMRVRSVIRLEPDGHGPGVPQHPRLSVRKGILNRFTALGIPVTQPVG